MTTTTEVSFRDRPLREGRERREGERVRREDVALLSTHRGGPHVSLFLPTVRAGQETQQNPIRFKNLLRAAAARLGERGAGEAEVDDLLAPARELIDDYGFWQHQGDGLAVFLAHGFARLYRLPLAFTELAMVEDRFHLKSLFPLFADEGRFFVLALSQNDVRLLAGSRHEVREVPLVDVPKSLADALGHELTDNHLFSHTGGRAQPGGGPVYHGQSANEENAKEEIRKFFSVLDRGVRDLLDDDGRSPLVLAGVEYLLPIYRELSSYPNVLAEGVRGNPDGLSAGELHRRAWGIVEERFRAVRRDAAARYGDLAGTGRASRRLDEVVPAAHDGRVDTLFVARGVRQWGRFDPASRQIDRHPDQRADSEDLLDRAAVETFVNSGTVHAVEPEEVPEGGPAAAIFRY